MAGVYLDETDLATFKLACGDFYGAVDNYDLWGAVDLIDPVKTMCHLVHAEKVDRAKKPKPPMPTATPHAAGSDTSS